MRPSEGHARAAVTQQAGQDAAVQLVELHELQQVREASLAVVHAEVQAAFLLALGDSQTGQGVRERREGAGPPWLVRGHEREHERAQRHGGGVAWGASRGHLKRTTGMTHREDKIMFDLLQVAQREDKALWVPLTLSDQEQAARR